MSNDFSIKNMTKFSFDIFRIIFTWSIFGFLASLIYVYVAPNKFQVHGSIQISNKYTNYQLRPITLEGFDLRVLSLFESPNFYDATFLNVCKVSDGVTKDLIKKEIRNGYIYISFYSRSKEQGLGCMDLILKRIEDSSNSEVNRMLKANEVNVHEYKKRLEEVASQMKKIGNSDIHALSGALLFRSEIYDLKNKLHDALIYREALVGILKNNEQYFIYADNDPVSPSIKKSISLGLLLGGVFGFGLYSLKRKILMQN